MSRGGTGGPKGRCILGATRREVTGEDPPRPRGREWPWISPQQAPPPSCWAGRSLTPLLGQGPGRRPRLPGRGNRGAGQGGPPHPHPPALSAQHLLPLAPFLACQVVSPGERPPSPALPPLPPVAACLPLQRLSQGRPLLAPCQQLPEHSMRFPLSSQDLRRFMCLEFLLMGEESEAPQGPGGLAPMPDDAPWPGLAPLFLSPLPAHLPSRKGQLSPTSYWGGGSGEEVALAGLGCVTGAGITGLGSAWSSGP